MNASYALLAAGALTLALYLIPAIHFLAWPLILISTLVHELGHGLSALLLGGQFETLNMWPDASGAASYRGSFSDPQRALIAAAGPLGPPLAALGFFFGARTAHGARVALGILAAVLFAVCLLWVRTLFGFIFVLGFSALLAAVAWWATPRMAQILSAFLGIQMSLAAFSRADYLFTSIARTGGGAMASDTQQIALALWLPYWFWGGLIALLSLAILGLGLWSFARAVRL